MGSHFTGREIAVANLATTHGCRARFLPIVGLREYRSTDSAAVCKAHMTRPPGAVRLVAFFSPGSRFSNAASPEIVEHCDCPLKVRETELA